MLLGGTRAILGVVFAAILFGMTACGSTPAGVKEGAKEREKAERPPTPVETVRLAYETTAKAESSKFSTRSVITGLPQQEGMPQSLTIVGEGSGSMDGKRAQMTMQMPMFGEMEVRYVGSTMYQKMPEPFTAQAPPGKRWVEIDQEKLMKEEYGTSLSEMQEGTQGTPSDQLAYLRGVSDSVEKLGTEEVRGAPTTHYRADVDLDKAAPKDPEARRAFERMTEDLRAEKIPTEVWIDEEGRVRRYEMTMAMPLPEGTPQDGQGDPSMTMTAEYYDFGTPVNVEPPPKDKTISFEKLIELQRQQQQSPQRQQTFKS